MLMQIKMIILCIVIGFIEIASSVNFHRPSLVSPPLFAADLLGHIAQDQATKNVVFSPISIHTALTLTYLGASGRTAEELGNGLRFYLDDREKVGQYFSQILNKNHGQAKCHIANGIFVNSDLQLNADFKKRSQDYFKSGVESLDFKTMPLKAIDTINTWVENETNNKITNIMKPGSVDSDTAAVIVNAIYFKGHWEQPFSADMTRKIYFWMNENESVKVDTMIGSGSFNYGEFPELDATAIEMPYKDSDISMLLILPSQKTGLADLESKLGSISINGLSSSMTSRTVDLMIPKFKIEFSTSLASVLKKMGIRMLFENAQLDGIFQSRVSVKVSDVQHKAMLDVNEAGSEAAAASFITIRQASLDINQKYFNADHPFYFAIKDSHVVYFSGHVAKF